MKIIILIKLGHWITFIRVFNRQRTYRTTRRESQKPALNLIYSKAYALWDYLLFKTVWWLLKNLFKIIRQIILSYVINKLIILVKCRVNCRHTQAGGWVLDLRRVTAKLLSTALVGSNSRHGSAWVTSNFISPPW